jgi:hypothetical protein
MAPEIQKQKPDTPESALDQAAKDLREYKVKEGDTRAEIQAKLVKLQTDRDALQMHYDEANGLQRYKETAKLYSMMTQMDELIKGFEDAKAKAPFEEAPVPKAKMEKGEARQKTKDEYTAEIRKQSAIIDSQDPKVTTEQKQAAQEARAEAQEALQKLEAKEKRDHAMETVAKYKAEEARSRGEEQVELERLEAELNGEKTTDQEPSDGKSGDKSKEQDKKGAGKEVKTDAKPETSGSGSLAERADKFSYSMLTSIVGNPPNSSWEKFTTSSKIFVIKLSLALAGEGNHSWAEKFDANQQAILLKVVGLKITPGGKTSDTPPQSKFKLEWVEPDKEFLGPDKVTQDVFAQYFGKDKWMATYEPLSRIVDEKNGKASIKQIRDQYSIDPQNPEHVKVIQLLNDLIKAGANEDSVFLEAVSKKGYALLNSTPSQSSRPAETTDKRPDRPLISLEGEEVFKNMDALFLEVIDEHDFNSTSKISEVFKELIPRLMEPILSPEYGLTLYKTLSQLPSEVLRDVISTSAFLEPKEKATMLDELDKTGQLSDASLKKLAEGIYDTMETSFKSPEFSEYMSKSEHFPPAWKSLLEQDAPFSSLLELEISQGHSVESNKKLLAALKANDGAAKEAPRSAPEAQEKSPYRGGLSSAITEGVIKTPGGVEHGITVQDFYGQVLEGMSRELAAGRVSSESLLDPNSLVWVKLMLKHLDPDQLVAVSDAAQTLTIGEKMEWDKFKETGEWPSDTVVARLAAAPGAEKLFTPAVLQDAQKDLENTALLQSLGLEADLADALKGTQTYSEFLTTQIAANKNVEVNKALLAAFVENDANEIPPTLTDYESDVSVHFSRYAPVVLDDGKMVFGPRDSKDFVDVSGQLSPDALLKAFVPHLLAVNQALLDRSDQPSPILTEEQVAQLKTPEGYRSFKFNSGEDVIHFDVASNSWKKEDDTVYVLPSAEEVRTATNKEYGLPYTISLYEPESV